ncbi:MAG: hypothetical protein JL50_10855 [Peptococcaceae bacterium BICA1-7]|nr:MAG: hypothetical protein JL50_10855 [Peptococcaceae bacterium BICA1-7]
MALTTCSVATNNVASLDDLPNDVGGLTPAQLKAVFDKFGADFVAWFNGTHIPEVNALDAQNCLAVGSGSTSTTSTSYADVTNMSVTLTTKGNDLLVFFIGTVYSTTLGTLISSAFSLDAAAEVGLQALQANVANYFIPVVNMYRFTGVAAGSHTVKTRWKVDANTGFCPYRTMLVLEV